MARVDQRSDKQLLRAARQRKNFARWRWLFTGLTLLFCSFFIHEFQHPGSKETKGIVCFLLLLAAIVTGATAVAGWVYKWRPLSAAHRTTS